MMTITGVGYGDLSASNELEYRIAFSTMMVMGIVWAYVIGNLCKITGQKNPLDTQFQQRLDKLNNFMAAHHIDRDLRERLRAFLRRNQARVESSYYNELLEILSPQLLGEVVTATHMPLMEKVVMSHLTCNELHKLRPHRRWCWFSRCMYSACRVARARDRARTQRTHCSHKLHSHPPPPPPAPAACCVSTCCAQSFFSGAPTGFLVAIQRRMDHRVFAPRESVHAVATLMWLKKGVVTKRGAIMTQGSVWGEDFILNCIDLIDFTPAISLAFIEVRGAPLLLQARWLLRPTDFAGGCAAAGLSADAGRAGRDLAHLPRCAAAGEREALLAGPPARRRAVGRHTPGLLAGRGCRNQGSGGKRLLAARPLGRTARGQGRKRGTIPASDQKLADVVAWRQ
jgi:hypothetical protein